MIGGSFTPATVRVKAWVALSRLVSSTWSLTPWSARLSQAGRTGALKARLSSAVMA
jgi:hypothetical protein